MQPAISAAQVVMETGNSFEHVRKEIEELMDNELKNIEKFCTGLAYGKIPIC